MAPAAEMVPQGYAEFAVRHASPPFPLEREYPWEDPIRERAW